jgi:hypothetical protein
VTAVAIDRRAFLAHAAVGLALLALRPRRAPAAPPAAHRCGMEAGARQEHPHPDPRPGIDASHVVPRAQLGDDQDVVEAFDMVREIPQVADGIRCHCGCASLPGYRSLLSCYEGEGMARHCQICQGQARLAYDLHKRGRTLGVIRATIDRRF